MSKARETFSFQIHNGPSFRGNYVRFATVTRDYDGSSISLPVGGDESRKESVARISLALCAAIGIANACIVSSGSCEVLVEHDSAGVPE